MQIAALAQPLGQRGELAETFRATHIHRDTDPGVPRLGGNDEQLVNQLGRQVVHAVIPGILQRIEGDRLARA